MAVRNLAFPLPALLALACSPAPISPLDEVQPRPPAEALAEEVHFADLRQLTFSGENAEAYWSFDGKQLIFQSSRKAGGCDQIFRMSVADPKPTRVSTGDGVTTCSYFLPGDEQIVYATTHLAAPNCPAKPDHNQGYVWPIYDSYDIVRADADGSNVLPLTNTPGYDAEATVCATDGTIVFTSMRDGDLDLYSMDRDGNNVKRLTDTPGYDGGAFFNSDCSKLVWRASRPTGKALADYRRLLSQGLVRPTKLEIYVAAADGSDARQITYLNAAAFAPFFFPSSKRVLFSTNFGDARGREFDLWAVDVDGTDLERITYAPGFDAFPMFSPDGSTLAFSSNRATAPGRHDTNVFLVRWVDDAPKNVVETAAERVWPDISWLADPARGGRGIGSAGLEAAGAYIGGRFTKLGLTGGAGGGKMRQPFEVPTAVQVGETTALSIAGRALDRSDFNPLPFSTSGRAEGPVVFAGYGIVAAEDSIDDYAGVNAQDAIVLVRRFVPDNVTDNDKKRRYSDLRFKAWLARQRGARALLVVDAPTLAGDAPKDAEVPAEAPFPTMRPQGYGDAGLPVAIVKRSVGEPLIDKRGASATLTVELSVDKGAAFNVVAKLEPNVPAAQQKSGVVIVGAHYDHLGMGGPGSLAPDEHTPHVGADDNASGVAALIEVARLLQQSQRARTVLLAAFSAEESGVLGSTHFVATLPDGLKSKDIVAMLNMDMVGRLRNNQLSVLGSDSASEWPDLLDAACSGARLSCKHSGDGYGPSDQTPFYAAGVPVLHFFSGAHSDYHKPSDTTERVNAAGAGQIAQLVSDVAKQLSARDSRLSYQRLPAPPPSGDLRSYGASLGSIPDYAGPPDGARGVLLSGVRKGGAAEVAGMLRGDLLIKLSHHDIGDVRDLMYALGALKPEQTITAVLMRDGKRMELKVTLQKSTRSARPHR